MSEQNYDDPMLDFDPDPYYQDPRVGTPEYMAPPPVGVAAPEGYAPTTTQAPAREVTYQRDIAPAAGKLFDSIGADSDLSEQAKLQLQGNLLQGVAGITEQRDKISQMRENSELRQMRLETDRVRLEDVRNSRAAKQGMQSKLAGLNSQFEEVLKLPIEQRAEKVAEIEAKNFDVFASSPYAGARLESVKRTFTPPEAKQQNLFSSGAQAVDFASQYGTDEVMRNAMNTGDLTTMARRKSEIDAFKEANKTNEERQKEMVSQQDSLLADFTEKPFTLDMKDPDDPTARTNYMSDATHARAEHAVMLFGSEEDKAEWEEANENLKTRDKFRARIAQNVVFKAQINRFKLQKSEKKEDVAESAVPFN